MATFEAQKFGTMNPMDAVMFLGLGWQAWLTLLLFVSMFIVLARTKVPAETVFLSVVAILLITGCLSPSDALSGFSATSVVVVAVLFIVIAGLEETGVLQWIVNHLMGAPRTYRGAIIRLMLPVAALSSFMSNTTIVALFVNVVKSWSKKLGILPSKMLIPLTYAAGMGGLCTLIGSPTNLIIAGFCRDMAGIELKMFDPLIVALACLLAGTAGIILMQRLLPDRQTPESKLGAGADEVTTNLKIKADSHLVGQTVGETHILDELGNDCHLLGIIHFDGEVESVAFESESGPFLMGGDTLVFSGERRKVLGIGDRFGLEYNILYRQTEPVQGHRTLLSALILIAMVTLSAVGVMPLLNCCMLAALLMVAFRCCKVEKVISSINWSVIMVFASSVAFGLAIENTGLAQMMADNLTGLCGTNAVMAFIIMCAMTTLITEFISNTACAAIMTPIALHLATILNANPMTFLIGLMISCSSCFATPIGSPRHLLVFIPGGYRFNDFLRIGIPMDIIVLAVNVITCLLIFPIHV